jgi:hypothetical protein
MKYCHIQGQVAPHQSVDIVLTADALEELQRLVNAALTTYSGKLVSSGKFLCTDGEYFTIHIAKMSEEEMLCVVPPYNYSRQDCE